jgi:hypothetical protein
MGPQAVSAVLAQRLHDVDLIGSPHFYIVGRAPLERPTPLYNSPPH